MTEFSDRRLRIGSRRSPLAIWQAKQVQHRLTGIGYSSEIIPIQTDGDQTDRPIREIGGKGIFTRAIDTAVHTNACDIAVHSFKDMTSPLPAGMTILGYLAPESEWDIMVMRPGLIPGQWPPGTRIGTGSMRRMAFLKRAWPDLEFIPIRGNVDTRLAAIPHTVDAIVLSEVGIIRLRKSVRNAFILPLRTCLPAPGQGIIAITGKSQYYSRLKFAWDSVPLAPIHREFLSGLGAGCDLPLGCYGQINDGIVTYSVDAFNSSLSENYATTFQASEADAQDAAPHWGKAINTWLETH